MINLKIYVDNIRKLFKVKSQIKKENSSEYIAYIYNDYNIDRDMYYYNLNNNFTRNVYRELHEEKIRSR